MNDADLFRAALDARDRRIAKLERQLAESHAEVTALQAGVARRTADVITTGERVALFPSTRRVEYIDRAVDQIARLTRHEARESVIRQRVEDTFARLVRYGFSEEAARADAKALEAQIRAITGMTSGAGGHSA